MAFLILLASWWHTIFMSIMIEPLKADDFVTREALLEYLSRAWEEPKEEIENAYIVPSFTIGPPYVLLAFTEDRVVAGHIMLVIEEKGIMGINNQPWVYGLFVREDYRGQGIARTLLAALEEKCREHGYPYLYLDTVASEGYYRHIGGWEELGQAVWGEHPKLLTVMRKAILPE